MNNNIPASPNKKSNKNSVHYPLLVILIIAFILLLIFSFMLGFTISKRLYSTTSSNSNITQSLEDKYAGVTKPETYQGTNPNIVLEAIPDTAIAENTSAQDVYEMAGSCVVGITSYVKDQNNEYQVGYGSGIIMSSDGYILTNAHVLQDSYHSYTVSLSDGTEYKGLLVAADNKSDIGILKIEAEGLTAAHFGDSSQISVGQRVYAIGNPSGPTLSNSISAGIISGTNRNIQIEDSISDISYIQTDAAINPGNSGGALINEYGQVIGINTAKISGVNYDGLGFSIPIDQALPIINELFENGRVTGRTKLGAKVGVVDKYYAESLGMSPGLIVSSISPVSNLYHAGIRVNDIITYADGFKAEDFYALQSVLSSHEPGDYIDLIIERKVNNEVYTFNAKVKLMEDIEEF